ncbi:MAG: hypothetical protein JSS63_07680 [Bacteroidetes bacterium]|nr:hypothetical protein [Bacteroidota bacterium]
MEVREKMSDKSNFETVTIHKNDLSKYSWGKKELNVDGKLFDIVSQDEKEDSLVFSCVRDKKEEVLYTTLEKFLDYKESKKRNNETAQANLVKFLSLVTILPNQNNISNIDWHPFSKSEASLNFNSSKPSPDIPPPKSSFSYKLI